MRPIPPESDVPVTAAPPPARLHTRLRRSHGVRSGLVLGVATLVFSVGGYLFQTACIRYLGAARYSDVGALLALTAVISLPLGSVQMLIAREVAYLRGAGRREDVRAFLRRVVLRVAIPGGVAVTLLSMLATPLLQDALNVDSATAVVAGLSALGFLIVGAILFGFLQGTQRFRALGINYIVNGLARPLLVVPALLAGLGAAGALGVNALVALSACALAALALRDLWHGGAPAVRAPRLEPAEVSILIVGSLAFASLTNLDIVLANYFLDEHLAGVYSAAALVGKFVLLMPAAVVMVLLPKAASRAAVGATSQTILLLSAAVTFAITITVTGLLALVPESLLVWGFGADFREATDLLPYFGLAMTAAALVNVYLFVYLAHKDVKFPLLVAAAAIAQVLLIILWHPDPRSIVLAGLICGTAVLVVHEIAFPHAIVRVVRRRRAARAGGAPGHVNP